MITSLQVELVHYLTKEVKCVGTNVMWTLADGTKKSSRLPWVETVEGARRRIEKGMKK